MKCESIECRKALTFREREIVPSQSHCAFNSHLCLNQHLIFISFLLLLPKCQKIKLGNHILLLFSWTKHVLMQVDFFPINLKQLQIHPPQHQWFFCCCCCCCLFGFFTFFDASLNEVLLLHLVNSLSPSSCRRVLPPFLSSLPWLLLDPGPFLLTLLFSSGPHTDACWESMSCNREECLDSLLTVSPVASCWPASWEEDFWNKNSTDSFLFLSSLSSVTDRTDLGMKCGVLYHITCQGWLILGF